MLSIRPTAVADLAVVTALEDEPDTAEWLCETGPAWHERALQDPDQEHLVAEYDGGTAGFMVLAGLRRSDGVLELRRIVAAPAVRRTGVGRAMLKAAVACAIDVHDARRVWLDVKTQNVRARTLYESEGFVPTRTITEAIAEADGTTSDLLVMTREA
ncbi:MAG: GNAT family N-acetyltransferase [Propionibacteriales bacterium]|nr:GNAT family N-acetyltransferase [Propionibacteriales bacterium]